MSKERASDKRQGMKKDGKGREKKKVEDKKKGMEKDKKRWRKINETRGSCNCRLSLSRYLLLSSSDHARKDKEERKKRRRMEKE